MCAAKQVLVVDDHPAIRALLEAALSLEGYAVRTATHGRAALEQLATFRPCVILLDLVMPVLDGWGFLDAYRGLPGGDACIITMAAGLGDPRQAGDRSVHDHLRKPFDLDELFELLGRHATQHAPA